MAPCRAMLHLARPRATVSGTHVLERTSGTASYPRPHQKVEKISNWLDCWAMLDAGWTQCQASFTADMPSDEWTLSDVAGGVWFRPPAGDFANSGNSKHRDGESRQTEHHIMVHMSQALGGSALRGQSSLFG
eukprot:s27_g56.t1